jgi:hypothetical protein
MVSREIWIKQALASFSNTSNGIILMLFEKLTIQRMFYQMGDSSAYI